MTLSSVNTIWVLLGAALVFFMQAGFSMCEAGFARAKNTGNILMKNLMDFCIGTPCFWLIGFGVMFGAGSSVIGWFDPGIAKDYSHALPSGVPLWACAIFQTIFCATSATIVSGSMAERTKFSSYCIYSAAISLFIYPVPGHWIWGGGWLSQLGFHDFAGSTAVHMVGGVCAMIGAKMLGPRIEVEIICNESRLESLKSAMMSIGITGMTVSHVLGCGIQKGKPEYYRGIPVEADLLPKVQVDMVVSKVPVRSVIETAKKVLYTGHIGDGKIFVYDVENVVKVRTGEEGYDALQDD